MTAYYIEGIFNVGISKIGSFDLNLEAYQVVIDRNFDFRMFLSLFKYYIFTDDLYKNDHG